MSPGIGIARGLGDWAVDFFQVVEGEGAIASVGDVIDGRREGVWVFPASWSEGDFTGPISKKILSEHCPSGRHNREL
jgi:hypothetical protein